MTVAEVAIEPGHQTEHTAFHLDLDFEIATKIQLFDGYFFQIDFIEEMGVAKDILMIDGINYGF